MGVCGNTLILPRNSGGYVEQVNLGSGQAITVEHLANEAAASLGRNRDLIKIAAETVEDPNPLVVADAGRLRKLGWEPSVNLSEGLNRELFYLRSTGAITEAKVNH